MIFPDSPPSPSEVAGHYDGLDTFYRDLWGEHLHHGLWLSGTESLEQALTQMIDVVAAEANMQPDSSVCDVGAGYGGTARHLVRDYGAKVTALTVSEVQYRHATSHPTRGDNPHFLLRDWIDNGLPDASFDVVTAIESAAHMDDKARFMSEAYRVLRPGGRFVICAWLSDEHPRPWHVQYLLEPICREGRLAGLPTAAEYLRWMESTGFAFQNFEDLSMRVARTWSIVLRRLFSKLLTDPKYMRFLLDSRKRDRIFALTTLRLWLAYRSGAFRYGLFSGRKPR